MKRLRDGLIALFAGVGAASAQVAPNTVIKEPAPIGIAANQNTVLFSQPYCDGEHPLGTVVQRGVYTLTGTNPLVALPTSSSCAENYFADSVGLGGFPANELYISGLLNGQPVIFNAPATGGAVSTFVSNFAVETANTPHAALTFDTVGTFGFNLIGTGANGIQGYDANANPTFSYPNPDPGNFWLEASTVAPLTYAPCPGCLFVVAENLSGGAGAIYVIHPGAPSGTVPQFFATGPTEPEGIVFVPANPCAFNGNVYFVSAYTQPPGNAALSTGGAVLAYSANQLSKYVGEFLVPDERTGVIYAYTAGNAPGGSPNATVFSNTGYQLEASTMVACPVQTSTTGFMTGGGQTANFAASHGMELGCSVNSNHHNLEVNWGGNQFHLTSISSVTCYMDPTLGTPNPPSAGFNTLVLTGTGKYDGNAGATVNAIFTDSGEPGTSDQAMIVVTYNGNVVLNVPLANIATGNQQAHK